MNTVITIAAIWIFVAIAVAFLWHAAVGGFDDDNYPPKI
jgi:nitrogen fixation-related uncharacterized protein